MGELYERISKLCDERGISGFRLCKEIGMQPSVLTELKKGRSQILSAKNLQRVADYFGITVDRLLHGIEDEEKPAAKSDGPSELTEKQEEIRRLLALLPEQEAELILRQIQGLVQDR